MRVRGCAQVLVKKDPLFAGLETEIPDRLVLRNDGEFQSPGGRQTTATFGTAGGLSPLW